MIVKPVYEDSPRLFLLLISGVMEFARKDPERSKRSYM